MIRLGLYDGHLGEYMSTFLDKHMHNHVLREMNKGTGTIVENMHAAFKGVRTNHGPSIGIFSHARCLQGGENQSRPINWNILF